MRPLLASALLAVSTSVCSAQSIEPRSAADEVAQTRLFEAVERERWSEALAAFGQLEARSPRLLFLAARAHEGLGALERSAEALDAVIEASDGEHLPAIYMLARIRARQGRDDDAKDLLLTSSRLGQSVLRDMQSADNQAAFAALLQDSEFVVKLMRGSSACTNRTAPARDPFASPVREDVGCSLPVYEGEDPLETNPRVAQIEGRISELIREFRALAAWEDPDVDTLRARLSELRALLAELSRIDSDAVAARSRELETELQGLEHLLQPVRLELYVADGNQHLRAMAELIRQADFDEALARHALLQELCAQMRREELSVFHGNADQLLLRGDALARRARLEIKAAALPLGVSGIVIAPDPEPSRVVINDRIYEVGDEILDPETDEPIAELQLVEISPNTVRFRLADLEFVRALKARR